MAKKRKHERRRAREGALAILYSSDITELDVTNIVENGSYPADGIDLPEYGETLLAGIHEHLGEIDGILSSTSENWSVDRMPIVDRAILRLAVYEMLFVDDVPVSVAINEAVELAKAYGGEDESSRFVNGVLGRIARRDERASQAPSDAEPSDAEPSETKPSDAEPSDAGASDSASPEAGQPDPEPAAPEPSGDATAQ